MPILRFALAVVLAASSLVGSAAPTNNAAAAVPGYSSTWNGVQLEQILDVYANLLGRTLLVHPGIPRVSITLFVQNKTKAEFRKAIEDVLRENNIAIVPDGEFFDLVVPLAEEQKWTGFIGSFPAPKADGSKKQYTFVYDGVDLSQTLQVYASLTAKKWVETSLPPARVRLKTEPSLTKAEAIYALDMVMILNGLKAVAANDGTFKVVPFSAPDRK